MMQISFRPHFVTLLAVASVASACTKSNGDTGAATLPPEDTDVSDGGATGEDLPLDTSSGNVSDPEPDHLLTIHHEGEWSMSPSGGPWTELSGELVVTELLDGLGLDTGEEPECTVTYALSGTVDTEDANACSACAYTVDLTTTLSEGDADPCRDPELPVDEIGWRLGMSADQNTLYIDYNHTGLWIPWYEAEQEDDTARFWWEVTVGVAIEEEEEAR